MTQDAGISRRDFFLIVGASGASLWLPGCDPIIVPEFGARLTRPEDLVALRFEFAGMQLVDTAAGQELVPKGSGTGYLIVHFAPQHFLEQAADENAVDNSAGPYPPNVLPPPPVNARISGASRLVFKVPPGSTPIPFTSAGLLEAMRTLELNVAPHATPPDRQRVIVSPGLITNTTTLARRIRSTRNLLAAERYVIGTAGLVDTSAAPVGAAPVPLTPQVRPRLPRPGETALELPFRLILSPNRHARWAHAATSAQSLRNGRHELWHTRLATLDPATNRSTEAPHALRTLRAIWTRDFEFASGTIDAAPLPGAALPPSATVSSFGHQSILPSERAAIVHLSSNYLDWPNNPSYVPKPIRANKLMLSALGGWLDSNVNFTLQSPLSLVAWDHQAAMGRDYFVKVVKKGRLFPYGHQALFITITERKFHPAAPTVAYLWKRAYIEVIEPRRDYPESWRKFPYRSIIFKTLVTPNLKLPANEDAATRIDVADDTPFRFRVQGIDLEGNPSHFDLVATWYPEGLPADLPGDVQDARDAYDTYTASQRTSQLAGQRVAYSKNAKADDTTYETQHFIIDGTVQGDEPAGVSFPSGTGLLFMPGIAEAALNVEAIRHLIGEQTPKPFEYYLGYLQHGFPNADEAHPNRGEVLFSVKGGASSADFSKKSDTSGGFIDPSLSYQGLSRKTQLAADLGKAADDQFVPADYLPDAMLFGVIPFADVLEAANLESAPNFVTQALDAVSGFIEDCNALRAMIGRLQAAAQTAFETLTENIGEVFAAIDGLVQLGSENPDDVTGSALATVQQSVESLRQLLADAANDAGTVPGLLDAEREELQRRARALANVLSAVQDGLKAFATGLDLVKNLTVKLEWRAGLKADPLGFFEPSLSSPKGGFLLGVEARGKQVGDNPAGVSVVAGIENFKVNVFGKSAKLVSIPFKRILFKVESNRKPEIDVVFAGDIGFDDILAFIQTLAKLIPSDGFSDPPALEVDEEGIRASFSVPIPSIAVGVFSIQNMRLGAGFEIPFIGNPLSINFFFCTREEPFVLTVMMVGGGGFVNLKLSPRGIMLLEAAFEARAQLAVDFGVASGSISIAVGVYFRLEVQFTPDEKQSGELTGYLRFQGQVDVLGLISASITLLLEMTYEFESKKLVGRATLTIEVSIAFFSFSVEVSCERKLAGSNDDPTFLDQFEKLNPGTPAEYDPWAEYLSSFVLAAA